MMDEKVAQRPKTDSAPPGGEATRIVGIASSAGGLEAISLLAHNLPALGNAVYVVAQHMSPKHNSIMVSLVARETDLQVVEIEDDTIPQPNTIYITPPNSDVVLRDGHLRLTQPSGHPAGPKPSADRLFQSLAAEYGENSVGIVLSGTGSDGSYGIKAIREVGGITIAQDPGTAKYDGMPASAIETGCVDLTLSPSLIGEHLEKILSNPRDLTALRDLGETPTRMTELYRILLARTQIDFSEYKETTLNRRLSRRMLALGINTYDDYLDYCRREPAEVDALHRDFLISVTRFFRDPEQFARLREALVPKLREKTHGSLRAWVVGCATGEEAYSIAILLSEVLDEIAPEDKPQIQVFATDVDRHAIEVARAGTYPIAAAQDIPGDLLDKYFEIVGNEITVNRSIRARTLFSVHNVAADAPFINVDLVSLRNVLIYFNQMLQERVLARCHYALAREGLLFLGTSETVGTMSGHFEARNSSDRLFVKRSLEPERAAAFRPIVTAGSQRHIPAPRSAALNEPYLSLAKSVAPVGFLATREGRIVEIFGDISPFMQIRSGSASYLNVDMLAAPLNSEMPSLIGLALRNKSKRTGNVHDMVVGETNRVQVEVFPFQSGDDLELQCLVALNTRSEQTEYQADMPHLDEEEQRAHVRRMEQRMRSTQDALQQTVEELQTSNEELQALNEELQSTNEEFQATNEELETSNEELQSTNEELLTVNEELQNISAEKQAIASELTSTFASAPYPTMLVDLALMIRRASDSAMEEFNFGPLSKAGLHLSRCHTPTGFPDLTLLANEAIRLQQDKAVEVNMHGRPHRLIFNPVRDTHDQMFGLLLTLFEARTPGGDPEPE